MSPTAVTSEDMLAYLAQQLRRQGAATRRINGKVGFSLLASEPLGWTVDLRTPGGTWKTGVDPDCAVVVSGTAQGLVALVLEPQNVSSWAAAGALRIQGDAHALKVLGELLSGGNSLLATRMGGSK